jgi:flagellin
MANIGATTAFYKVETSLTRANNEVSKSMERLATGRQNANAGDRSSYVAMADTFRLDYVGTKAGIKGASVVMGYLETGMRTLDAASALLSRMQELAVLAANDTNTAADLKSIDAEAEALGDEFHRLLSTAKYKGKNMFVSSAGSEYVSLGGRDAEMTFGIAKVKYSNLYVHDYETYYDDEGLTGASDGADKEMAALADLATAVVVDGAKYEMQTAAASGTGEADNSAVVTTLGLAADSLETAATDPTGADRTAGDQFTATANTTLTTGRVAKQEGQLKYTASEGLFQSSVNTDLLIDEIEIVQARINTARVQAGSQYAALESAVAYTTDLTAQYELGYNLVNDVNFSMETAHLAKNQILQQAATAMLAQANQGQQGLLQLIQG